MIYFLKDNEKFFKENMISYIQHLAHELFKSHEYTIPTERLNRSLISFAVQVAKTCTVEASLHMLKYIVHLPAG